MRLCWWIFKLERCHKVYVLCSAKIIWPIQVHFLCTKMDTLMTQNWWNTNQGQGKQALKRQKRPNCSSRVTMALPLKLLLSN